MPESSEVVIETQHIHQSKRRGGTPRIPRNPLAQRTTDKQTQLASARRVIRESSLKGLKRLQGTLTSNLSSLYVNDRFEDGKPCRVRGCPLNPGTRAPLTPLNPLHPHTRVRHSCQPAAPLETLFICFYQHTFLTHNKQAACLCC